MSAQIHGVPCFTLSSSGHDYVTLSYLNVVNSQTFFYFVLGLLVLFYHGCEYPALLRMSILNK